MIKKIVLLLSVTFCFQIFAQSVNQAPSTLSNCGKPSVVVLINQIVGNFGGTINDIQSFKELSFDKEKQVRVCSISFDTSLTGPIEENYQIIWSDRENQQIRVSFIEK